MLILKLLEVEVRRCLRLKQGIAICKCVSLDRMRKQTRLRVALCFLAMGGWTASFVPRPVAGEVAKVMVVLPAIIADRAMAASQEAVQVPTSPPKTLFPAVTVENLVFTAGVSFLSITATVLVPFFGRYNDKNDLQFQTLGKKVDDINTTLSKQVDDINTTLSKQVEDINTKLDVVIAAALIGAGAAGSFFLFKT